jgi:hypothetical protein
VTEPLDGFLDGFPGRSYPLGANPSFGDLVRANVSPFNPTSAATPFDVSHGTTVLALKFEGGVLMAGDRRATEGFSIAGKRPRSSDSSRPSSSTMRRSKGTGCRWKGRPTGWPS